MAPNARKIQVSGPRPPKDVGKMQVASQVRWPFSGLHMVPGPKSAIERSKLQFRIFEKVEDRMFVVKQ